MRMWSKNNIFKICFFLITLIVAAIAAFAEEPASFIYDDKAARDPLWPLVGAKGTIVTYNTDLVISDLKLEGVMSDAQGKGLAIINGRIVKVDDSLGQFIVMEIADDSVILLKGDQRFELRLKKEN